MSDAPGCATPVLAADRVSNAKAARRGLVTFMCRCIALNWTMGGSRLIVVTCSGKHSCHSWRQCHHANSLGNASTDDTSVGAHSGAVAAHPSQPKSWCNDTGGAPAEQHDAPTSLNKATTLHNHQLNEQPVHPGNTASAVYMHIDTGAHRPRAIVLAAACC